MITTISKWGNGHGIRLSRALMEAAHLAPSDQLEMKIAPDGSLILRRVPKTKAERFVELFRDYQGDWQCTEADSGNAIGKEVIE